MNQTRREVLATGVAAAVGVQALTERTVSATTTRGTPMRMSEQESPDEGLEMLPRDPAPQPLRILFLGGTGFLGPHAVNHALSRGHHVTLFNRGRTNTHLFADSVDHLEGDRRTPDPLEGITALAQGEWDCVIDTSGYHPREVRASAGLLRSRVGHYIFVSTVSVYGDRAVEHMDESAQVATLDDPESADFRNPANYGALKAYCEQAAEESMPGRVANVRPGLIVGPRDNTDRFSYWPVRLDRGGDVLCPGDGTDRVQFIDARDLARWIIHLAETNATGTFNALGPAYELPISEFIGACKSSTSTPARLVWVETDFLQSHKVQMWSDMPLWIPARGDFAGVGTLSNAAAIKAGLAFRPIAQTTIDTIAWYKGQPDDPVRDGRVLRNHANGTMRSGLSPEREAEVLRAWQNR